MSIERQRNIKHYAGKIESATTIADPACRKHTITNLLELFAIDCDHEREASAKRSVDAPAPTPVKRRRRSAPVGVTNGRE
jgi:hypothetical protein